MEICDFGLQSHLQEVGFSVEKDGGHLANYLNMPISFGFPKYFYEYAAPQEGEQYFPLKKKYLLSSTVDKEGRFEILTQKYPERYANRVLAWFSKIGEVTLDKGHTNNVLEAMCSQIQKQEPIKLGLIYSLQKFTLADAGTDIKCLSPDPDISELEFFHSFWSINEVIKKEVYPLGLKIKVYNESTPFKHFPSPYGVDGLKDFESKVKSWIDVLGWEGVFEFGDLEVQCSKKPNYMEKVSQKFIKYLAEFENLGIVDNPFIKAESRNVYLPGLGINVTQDMLLSFYSVSGFVPLAGITCSYDSPKANDMVIWSKVVEQAKHQAAYSRAFLNTRGDYGNVYEDGEIPVTITKSDNKITLPTCSKKAQEILTHWNGGGVTVFPTAGVGVMTHSGIGVLPAYRALKVSQKVKYSDSLGINYLSL